jgi:hypothetical protein
MHRVDMEVELELLTNEKDEIQVIQKAMELAKRAKELGFSIKEFEVEREEKDEDEDDGWKRENNTKIRKIEGSISSFSLSNTILNDGIILPIHFLATAFVLIFKDKDYSWRIW